MSIATLSEIKGYLGISISTYDTVLGYVQNGIEQYIKDYGKLPPEYGVDPHFELPTAFKNMAMELLNLKEILKIQQGYRITFEMN